MKTNTLFIPVLLAAAGMAGAQTSDSAQRELRQAATGDSFSIGDTRFTLAPQAQVSEVNAKASADASQVTVGKYQVKLLSKSANSTARSTARASADASTQRMAAAVADTGKPVVVTSSLNVYVSNFSVIDAAVKASGGKLTYASRVGGNGRIEYASVGEAMNAMRKIQGLAGVKEVSPAIVEEENVLY